MKQYYLKGEGIVSVLMKIFSLKFPKKFSTFRWHQPKQKLSRPPSRSRSTTSEVLLKKSRNRRPNLPRSSLRLRLRLRLRPDRILFLSTNRKPNSIRKTSISGSIRQTRSLKRLTRRPAVFFRLLIPSRLHFIYYL